MFQTFVKASKSTNRALRDSHIQMEGTSYSHCCTSIFRSLFLPYIQTYTIQKTVTRRKRQRILTKIPRNDWRWILPKWVTNIHYKFSVVFCWVHVIRYIWMFLSTFLLFSFFSVKNYTKNTSNTFNNDNKFNICIYVRWLRACIWVTFVFMLLLNV